MSIQNEESHWNFFPIVDSILRGRNKETGKEGEIEREGREKERERLVLFI